MEAGIVGLPNVGKSTLFNALTAAGAEATNYPFCTIEPNVGVVAVPDPRLEIIDRHIAGEKKLVPATLRLVDIAGLVKGASHGEGLGNQFLSHIRNVDAILHTVRCFRDDSVVRMEEQTESVSDVQTVETELMLADLQVLENARDKAERAARVGDKEARAQIELFDRCEATLNDGRPIRAGEFEHDEQRRALKGIGLITGKPVLYVANVDDDDLAGQTPDVQALRQHAATHGGEVVNVCAEIEAELLELDPADRAELVQSLGLEEPALDTVARETQRLLGLQVFFTTLGPEIRAWTIPVGATAVEAAGRIHTDMAQGFIRVEVYSVEDLQHYGSEQAIRAAGKLRSEGKSYVVREGDVCRFLFNA